MFSYMNCIIIALILIFILAMSICMKKEYYKILSNLEKNKHVKHKDEELKILYAKSNLSTLHHNNERQYSDTKKYSIAFVTYENRTNLKFVSMHNENIKKYCDKYNYDYLFFDKSMREDLSPYWYKVYLMRDLLKNKKYDYIFWLDSDTFIMNFNIDLGKDILAKYNSDIFVASDNTKYDICNAGLFVIRNSDTGLQFLSDWMNMYSEICTKKSGLRGTWALSCYEQGNLNKLILEKYKTYTTMLNHMLFYHKQKCNRNVFIMHLYANSEYKRVNCFTKKIYY